MSIPASIATGGHANDAEIVDAQAAITALLGAFSSSVLKAANGGTSLAALPLTVALGGTSGQWTTGGNDIILSTGAAASQLVLRPNGAGSTVAQTIFDTTTATFGGTITMGGSGPTITTGTAAPSAAEVDGSIYLRSGAPNGSLYVRQNGVWTLK